jgi:Sulfotransferase family
VTSDIAGQQPGTANVTTIGGPFDFEAQHQAIARLRAKQIFFIGGTPKSGTTWVQLLLNAHPEISCGGEGHFMNRLLPAFSRSLTAYNKTIRGKNQSIFGQTDWQPLFQNRHMAYLVAAAASMMLSRPAKAATARIVGDKTPDNVRHFPMLATLFPRAKFIHVVRDGRDCAVSAWFHNLRLNPERTQTAFPTFEAFSQHFAQSWVSCVRHGARFAARQPARCVQIRYEDLYDAPLKSLDRLCVFLGASRDVAVLEACQIQANFTTLSGGRQRGEEDRGSFFRRGMRGEWRDHFDAASERAFRAKVEPWLTNFGYVPGEMREAAT